MDAAWDEARPDNGRIIYVYGLRFVKEVPEIPIECFGQSMVSPIWLR